MSGHDMLQGGGVSSILIPTTLLVSFASSLLSKANKLAVLPNARDLISHKLGLSSYHRMPAA